MIEEASLARRHAAMKPAKPTPTKSMAAAPGRAGKGLNPLVPIAGVAILLALGALVIATRYLPSDGESLPALRERASILIDSNQMAEAQPLIDRLMAAPSPTDEDRLIVAIAAKKLGRPDEASASLAKIEDTSPIGPRARYIQGQIERERFRVRKAEEYLLHALELDPNLASARGELIYIYGMQLRRQELSEQFRKLLEIRPLSFQEVFLWCLSRRVDWDPESVITELTSYHEADPDDRISSISLAESLRQATRFDEADKVLGTLPADDPEAIALRARVALDRGDPQKAETLLKAGDPLYAGIAKLRGRLALSRRDWPRAAEQFGIAIRDMPEDRDTLFGLGHSLTQLGETKEAEGYIEKARAQDQLNAFVERAANHQNRNDPELVRSLGAACERVGRRPEARAWYQILIAKNPLDRDAQAALFRLKDPRGPTTP